jgi:putative ABC transport system ATP-binding protein
MNDSSKLQIRHVTKRFGSDAAQVTAVRDVSLDVAPGEIVLIMGPSGSGKTTLLSMLGVLLKPTEGEVRLDGEILSTLAENRLSGIRLHKFGFIFQDFNLLSALSALENVALVAELAGVKRSVARQKAVGLLTELGLGERLDFLPEKLSGGEKQRVGIARAMVNDPVLILADEPTANLHSSIGHEIMSLLRRIAKEKAHSMIIVSHDQRLKEMADRVLWLEDGQFKDRLAMATDPVCGMALEREKAVIAKRNGKIRYFCSCDCHNRFLEDPQRFTEQADIATSDGRSKAEEGRAGVVSAADQIAHSVQGVVRSHGGADSREESRLRGQEYGTVRSCHTDHSPLGAGRLAPNPRKVESMSVRSEQFRRVSRRDRTRARSRQVKQEKLKEFAYASARGAGWSVLFFGLMISLVTALVTFLAGESVYAVLAFLFGLLGGAALLKRESS